MCVYETEEVAIEEERVSFEANQPLEMSKEDSFDKLIWEEEDNNKCDIRFVLDPYPNPRNFNRQKMKRSINYNNKAN